MTTTWPIDRWWRSVRSPLGIALLLSLLLHGYVWLMAVLIEAALANGWIPKLMEPAVVPLAAKTVPPPTNAPPAEVWKEVPLQFVEVDPTTISDAPDDATFFSTANTRAANPDPKTSPQNKPRLDGKREDSLKTFDTAKPTQKAQPTPEAESPPDQEAVAERRATPTPKPAGQEPKLVEKAPPREEVQPGTAPGETLLAKATLKSQELKPLPQTQQTPQKATQPEEQARPQKRRTPKRLAEVMPARGLIVGETMRQEGGVSRMSVESSLDVKASPLGDYHYRMVLAVQQQWYRLLEERRYALERIGKVVVSFDLHSDGSISGIETKQSEVGETLSFLCELSVMQPAPFGRWPADIRRMVGGDVIPVTFTFNYY
ncbi:MAG: hypothetical protein FJ379_02730 [Verrucomicrobia bacterium]|nr:hypothetical protein [Verrucomicrobiota bacterium]